MSAIIYALRDNGVPDCVKIGKDTRWPKRLEQARSHTPRGISVVATWSVPEASLGKAEKQAIAGLARRTQTPAKEWYDCDLEKAVESVTNNLGIQPNPTPTMTGLRSYDDWRSLPEEDKDHRKRLWVHVEDAPVPRIKVIPSVFYDTAYRYVFTYNPYPVFLVAAYQSPEDNRISRSNENARVWSTWQGLVRKLGSAVPSDSIGWLDQGLSLDQLDAAIRSSGLVPYPLGAPKPRDAPPRDSSVAPIAYGALPPMERVRVWHSRIS